MNKVECACNALDDSAAGRKMRAEVCVCVCGEGRRQKSEGDGKIIRHDLARIYEGRTWRSRALVTALQASLRYFSRYFGKSVANEDSSAKVPPLLSAAVKGSTFHYTSGRGESPVSLRESQ